MEKKQDNNGKDLFDWSKLDLGTLGTTQFPTRGTDVHDYREPVDRFRDDFRGRYQNSERDKLMVNVPMNFAEVTTADSEKPLVGTESLASCAGIAIYDPETKVGGVAHVFFTGKETMTVYMRDAQGRDIPSSGREIIVNNPTPFEPLKWKADELLQKGKAKGGKNFQLSFFNIQHGARTREQNEALERRAESLVQELGGEISSKTYRNEQAFVLDTRDGSIRPL